MGHKHKSKQGVTSGDPKKRIDMISLSASWAIYTFGDKDIKAFEKQCLGDIGADIAVCFQAGAGIYFRPVVHRPAPDGAHEP